MTRLHTIERRTAFTLVEMMVASALIIFMMWIIASAFQSGLESFRVLKTAGDLQEKLRGAATAIRRDLTRPHFNNVDEADEDLSNQRLDQPGWVPPSQGYFRIFQDEIGTLEGLDADDTSMAYTQVPGIPTLPNPPTRGHVLQFTTRLKGLRTDQYFHIDPRDTGILHQLNFPTFNRRSQRDTALPPPGGSLPAATDPESPTKFTSIWAEVTYFARANGSTVGGRPLYNLYRRQNIVTTDTGDPLLTPIISGLSVDPSTNPEYLQVSSWPFSSPAYRLNTQKTVTGPIRRFGVSNAPAGNFMTQLPRFRDQLPADHAQNATDLLLTDVTSFSVKVMWDPSTASGSTTPPQLTLQPPFNNPEFPFDNLPPVTMNTALTTQRVFDTWSSQTTGGADDYSTWNNGYGTGTAGARTIPIKIRVRAIQIQLRIWDVKSQQSRQITIIQDV
jgi:hypothetical protein